MRSAIWLPLFDQLADPRTVARLAADAEEYGWHGFFVWDHVRWRAPVRAVADPWVTLSAAAMVTETLRLGPMITPLARRRPVKVARETASLDVLSGGRLTLGVGVGDDRFGAEYSATGEQGDDKARAAMLDEALAILTAAWTGEPVHHRGAHYTVDDVTFLPRPVQRPGVPVWVAGFPGRQRPMRRAARHDGYFPVNLEHPDQLAEAAATIAELRGPGPYDIAVELAPGTDPRPYAAAGATWWLTAFDPASVTVDEVHGVLRAGPLD
ncbi:LLM class flavin-dependent oxidoreductase [Dactylosporangium sp. AC04546]|uniref:LLM class flavin-dependent oxidoreductase n=1 Tax=Dactylosporangium sp. AC04546 TaxID=2862460 RepID=UPI001EDF3F9B|nr:LLM class flavin-dependent oxidoreductase [Dactylosporangium sp. AC04546]WVK79212.1 LLM class flavin-dependent oxidoreductase [Dactylosporangium sp. AC04546]